VGLPSGEIKTLDFRKGTVEIELLAEFIPFLTGFPAF
jgi:hypothetical protein